MLEKEVGVVCSHLSRKFFICMSTSGVGRFRLFNPNSMVIVQFDDGLFRV